MPGLKYILGQFVHQNRTNRESATKSLCQGDNIGMNIVLLAAEECSCSADARLYLVHDQHNVIFLAERFQILCVLFFHRSYAALALDKLHHDTADRCINRIGQLLVVVDRHISKALSKREKVLVKRILPCCSQCSDGSAVERIS